MSHGILQGTLDDEERCILAFLILSGLVAESEVDSCGGVFVAPEAGH